MSSERFGGLTVVPGLGIALGDTGGAHVVFAVAGILSRSQAGEETVYSWGNIDSVDAEVPDTLWPTPVIGDVIIPLAFAVFAATAEVPDVKPLSITLIMDGVETRLDLAPHHAVGYRRRHARAIERLIVTLVEAPKYRSLLDQPAAILSRLKRNQLTRE
ncbi:hypothetical protein G7067_13000 [Leucobacter insecticola]|uniref:Uncharacterized protein n=1 Tax=Leucobacter insecticola TaxID=2714934 RepID=A0A6G8FLA0_9MICO|nr:hypothetical protein [Leucobacter insecticola]QIM17118.1 hypothetical protein G7067_13000 [Leucobacter insecticola]